MVIALPERLEEGIDEALRGVPSSQWTAAARRLSNRYRAGVDASNRGAHGPLEALGYAGLILPATYAQLVGAMAAVAARMPGWQPRALLDIGSGPGTALWAALAHWPTLQALTAWEREAAFIALGQRLAARSEHPALRATAWRRVTLGQALPRETAVYDLVVIGHVLGELDAALREHMLSFAWTHCSGVVLVVEPGTSTAFPVVSAARNQLLNLGARTLAPCVHDRPCPLVDDWCHFPQRLRRPSFQRRARAGTAGWEESKFSYAAMGRLEPAGTPWARLIHQPHPHAGYVELTASSREGIVRPRVAKADRDGYTRARDYRWGDLVVDPPAGRGVHAPME